MPETKSAGGPKRPRDICIALPQEQRVQLRQVARATGLNQGDLREALENSKLVAEAATEALRRMYNAWKVEQGKHDPFAAAENRQSDQELRNGH
jgi:hypothetical protein